MSLRLSDTPASEFRAAHEDRRGTLSRGGRAVRSLSLLSLTCLTFVAAAVSPVSAADAPKVLKDKTLVVWVAPADLTQQGGSALTIDNNHGVFDGVVLGEMNRKRWMPGSDFHRRTPGDQEKWPEESVDAKTFVQIAIVYGPEKITAYRNGKVYCEYPIKADAVATFTPDSTILIGPRHLEAMTGGSFKGRIDDARIYDVALTAEQIAALKPNESSEPQPWAWWTFDDKDVKEKTGRLKITKLAGKAKVDNGSLVLDGGGMLMAKATDFKVAVTGTAVPAPAANSTDISRAHREYLLSDPHRPGYHFAIPEGRAMPFDPNGAIYWKGRYHMFYIYQDKRGHNFGHISSTDLFHWRFHPTGLTNGMFSGNAFVNKDGKPTICYHQVGLGNSMAVALDDDLNNWEKLSTNPITPKASDPLSKKYRSWDPYGWVENDTYYAIFGGKHPGVVKCDTLGGDWKYVGDLMGNSVPGVDIEEDVSCADFFKLGDKHMLLCISHRLGARYYLGDWKNEQFHPTFHEKMSWVDNSFFAPESLVDDKGRRIMWSWIFDNPGFQTRTNFGWSGTMSLPRVLTLDGEGHLRMNPPEELDRLRYNEQSVAEMDVPADEQKVVPDISGNSKEIDIEMIPDAKTKRCGVVIGRSPDGAEQTLVYYDVAEKKLKVDTRKSSLGDGAKTLEAGPLEIPAGEPVKLRVYFDKSVVEVFANDGRQAVMRRVYPSRQDSRGVALMSEGGTSHVKKFTAWDMSPSNPY